MHLLLVFLSLIGSSVAGLFGHQIGFHGSIIVIRSCTFLSLLISFFAYYEVNLNNCFVYIKLIEEINLGIVQVDIGFMFDNLTVVMCCIINLISFLLNNYLSEYMSHDPYLPRLMSKLSSFTFFMLVLVTSDNFLQMFIGWKGVGFYYCLLMGIFFQFSPILSQWMIV